MNGDSVAVRVTHRLGAVARDAAGTRDKLSYDHWYLRHRSLLVDLAICVRTFWILVTGAGAR